MVTVKTLEAKTKSLKNLIVKPLLINDQGKVEAFVALYARNGIGNRLSEGLREVNKLWDQQSSKRPEGYYVYGDLYDSDSNTGASLFVSEEYYDNTTKEEKEFDKEKWQHVCRQITH